MTFKTTAFYIYRRRCCGTASAAAATFWCQCEVLRQEDPSAARLGCAPLSKHLAAAAACLPSSMQGLNHLSCHHTAHCLQCSVTVASNGPRGMHACIPCHAALCCMPAVVAWLLRYHCVICWEDMLAAQMEPWMLPSRKGTACWAILPKCVPTSFLLPCMSAVPPHADILASIPILPCHAAATCFRQHTALGNDRDIWWPHSSNYSTDILMCGRPPWQLLACERWSLRRASRLGEARTPVDVSDTRSPQAQQHPSWWALQAWWWPMHGVVVAPDYMMWLYVLRSYACH